MEQQFENLDTYILLAKKVISKFAPTFYSGLRKELLSNDDAISDIANAIMIADWKWDKNRKGHNGQSKTKYSYRNQCGLWAIQTYITTKYRKKNNHYSLDHHDNNDTSYIKNIVDKSSENPANIIEERENTQIINQTVYQLINSDILSEKQKKQIYKYYFENKTLLEIGKEYGVTREAIRQNIQKGIAKIKAYV